MAHQLPEDARAIPPLVWSYHAGLDPGGGILLTEGPGEKPCTGRDTGFS